MCRRGQLEETILGGENSSFFFKSQRNSISGMLLIVSHAQIFISSAKLSCEKKKLISLDKATDIWFGTVANTTSTSVETYVSRVVPPYRRSRGRSG